MAMTDSSADLKRDQEEQAGLIQRFWTNICKLGKEKMMWALLEHRKTVLETYWDTFFQGHRRLMRCKEAATSTYVRDDVFGLTEEAYLQAGANITQVLGDRSTTSTRTKSPAPSPPRLEPQLPKIELPTFSGNPLQWERFRDLFRSLVHDVPQLPDVKKLLYLKSCLAGEAAEVVQNTPITVAGYRGAWDDLELRYGNTRLLSFTHHIELQTCPPAQHASPCELKRLLDTFRQAIRAYSALKKPIKEWDEWFLFLLSQKLDDVTHMAWESSLDNSREIPPFDQLTTFLENRIQALETTARREPLLRCTASGETSRARPKASSNGKRSTTVLTTQSRRKEVGRCPCCSGSHYLGYCARFKALTPAARKERVCSFRLCLNCLSGGHETRKCASKQVCRMCSRPHHSMLHDAYSGEAAASTSCVGPTRPASANASAHSGETSHSATSLSVSARPRSATLLATARVTLEGPSGHTAVVRALLDTGSDSSFVSEWVVQALHLPRRAVCVALSCVQDQKGGVATAEVDFVLKPRGKPSTFRLPVQALVLKKLTSFLPIHQVPSTPWPHLDGIPLADPEFGVPARVDLILGSDVCGSLLYVSTRKGPAGTPTAKLTPFGWVLMGPTSADGPAASGVVRSYHCQTEERTDQLLQRFWEVEELAEAAPLSAEEERAETHFRDTHTRDESGRYVVRLPFHKNPTGALGHSRSLALKLLLSCERRLAANPPLKESYTHFMTEYLSLDHMEAVAMGAETDDHAYYIPHHAVVKRHDPAAELRVVFNASLPTSSGVSLNDCLSVGPKLQSDLWMILTRWRFFRLVFTTDIVKMYRQIRVHPSDAPWQRILWRPNPDDPVQAYNLSTVTYGTASAPFLALRVMHQLAADEEQRYPLGAMAMRRHRYVDDILAGADEKDQAHELKRQVVAILEAGAFRLSKWASNAPALGDPETEAARLFQDAEGLNTLGIRWSPREDTLALRAAAPVHPARAHSKRSILSDVARLFDPLGWAAPVLIYAKILMQDLWILGVEWDEALPSDIQHSWTAFTRSLRELDRVEDPRWTHFSPGHALELHGFCDASQRAYAAAVYIRVAAPDADAVTSTLLVAKTKVAPVKTLSIPRLELCGAALLANLLVRVRDGLELPASVTAWTDSSVALTWIRGRASQWKPFVAHRVAAIQTSVASENWGHVASAANPADLATRGICPAELLAADLWWNGPSWLTCSPSSWPSSFPKLAGDAEIERRKAIVNVAVQDADELCSRFSSLFRLVSVVAYYFRFAALTRGRSCPTGHIRPSERAAALRALVRRSQWIHFPADIEQLRKHGELRKASSFQPLRPILDKQGLLRVGGRLASATLPYNERHPLIVARACPLARLLVLDAHLLSLHGGPQLTSSLLARQYWILRGRILVRAVIRDCVRCARFSGRPASQLMGQLPEQRTTPQRAFLTSGVDYAGPIMLRSAPGRGHKAYKGYIALFICLATRAIHLEAVSDLSSASFLAAFRRFIGRRGRCTTLFSDNGTAFRGADRELRSMFHQAADFYKDAAPSLAADGTDWKFIAPRAPHFGGLWEAGVKSVKHHLRCVIGDAILTFEEITTLLCQVEACLNSRPLYTLSADPSDLAALTPGHFLIGEPLAAVPEADAGSSCVPLSTRWKLISQMRASFWQRWRLEYLHHLQQLPKWRQAQEDLAVGTLVLIRDELQPPTKWSMGRVQSLHPGKDGKVRVVTLRTANGLLTRPIVKLCPLPVAPAHAASG